MMSDLLLLLALILLNGLFAMSEMAIVSARRARLVQMAEEGSTGARRLVSLTDVTAAIVGELPPEPGEEPSIVRRDDGSWLLDGSLDIDTVLRTLGDDSIVSEEDSRHYHTLGGLVMSALGRVPQVGSVFERGRYRFEVVDMDGNRVDRVLVSRLPEAGGRS